MNPSNERPRYRLTAPMFVHESTPPTRAVVHFEDGREGEERDVSDELLTDKHEIVFDGPPGHHMQPLNEAARAMVKKHNPKPVNPVDELSLRLTPPDAAQAQEGTR